MCVCFASLQFLSPQHRNLLSLKQVPLITAAETQVSAFVQSQCVFKVHICVACLCNECPCRDIQSTISYVIQFLHMIW